MRTNTRHMLISVLVLLVVALVSAAGFVGCELRAPSGPGDPSVHGSTANFT